MRLREHTHTCCMIMFGIIQATDEETETDREKKMMHQRESMKSRKTDRWTDGT